MLEPSCDFMMLYDFSPNSFNLATGVLTSSWWVRVRRFCGFIAGGAITQGVVVSFNLVRPSLSLWTACRRGCWGIRSCCVVRHQPTQLGREPRVCTVGRVQMPSRASRWHAHGALMWGHGGKRARNPRTWAWAVHFPWGQPRCTMGKLGRPHILSFAVWYV